MMHDESSSMRHNNVMNVEQQRLQKFVLHIDITFVLPKACENMF